MPRVSRCSSWHDIWKWRKIAAFAMSSVRFILTQAAVYMISWNCNKLTYILCWCENYQCTWQVTGSYTLPHPFRLAGCRRPRFDFLTTQWVLIRTAWSTGTFWYVFHRRKPAPCPRFCPRSSGERRTVEAHLCPRGVHRMALSWTEILRLCPQ